MSVSSTEHLDKLAFILYDRPAGRNVIGYAIEKIEQLRAENERLREENDELYRAAGRTRAALSGWVLASPGREDEPTHELVAEVVAEAERLRFQRSLRKLRDKP